MTGQDQSQEYGGDAGCCKDSSIQGTAYASRNVSAIRAHQEQGIVPRQYAPIAAEVLEINLDEVRIKKD